MGSPSKPAVKISSFSALFFIDYSNIVIAFEPPEDLPEAHVVKDELSVEPTGVQPGIDFFKRQVFLCFVPCGFLPGSQHGGFFGRVHFPFFIKCYGPFDKYGADTGFFFIELTTKRVPSTCTLISPYVPQRVVQGFYGHRNKLLHRGKPPGSLCSRSARDISGTILH